MAGNDELVLGGSEEMGAPPRFGGEASDAPAERSTPRVAPGGGGGSTLFERMANLSRGGSKSADDEDDGGALNIPRFLGRQNNQ